MINSLNIQNYQSHKNSLLEFHPGVNVIVGSSDAGKSAILRALRKLIWNKPMGEAFRSTWGGQTSITANFDDLPVSWIKDKETVYKLGEQEFKAFSTEVPPEIVKAVNMGEINLQQQLDSHFLLSNISGDVAKHFNRIAHLEKIDSATASVNSSIAKVSRSIEADKKTLSSYQEELKEFDGLTKAEIELEVLETMEVERLRKIKQIDRLRKLIDSLLEIEKKIEKASEILKAEPKVIVLLGLYTEQEKKIMKHSDLLYFISSIKTIQEEIEAGKEIIKDETHVNSLLGKYQAQTKLQKEERALKDLISSIAGVRIRIADKGIILKKKEIKFKKEFPDVCPFCETNLKKK